MLEETLRKGDFVWFTYDTKEIYPGRIVDIEKDGFLVEICTSKRKNSENGLERVKGKKHQIRLRTVG